MNKTNSNKKKPTSPQTKEYKNEIVDLELKARYWEAQFKIRDFSLKCEVIQPEYEAFLERDKKRQEEFQKQFEEYIQKLKEQGGDPSANIQKAAEMTENREGRMIDVTVTQEILDLNPDMVTEGVKVGDIIQISEDDDLTPEEVQKELLEELESIKKEGQ